MATPLTWGRGLACTQVLIMASLVGCSALGDSAIIVPALWASSDGQAAGIEPATVTTTTERDEASVTIDVSQESESGAGASWIAASASAAATAILLSGTDPTAAGVSFDVTGPIDGPSAGGILTIGVLAGLLGRELDPSVTMTGTIAPDGSIGTIGGVAEKVAAATDAGFTTVVLPAGENAEEGLDTPQARSGAVTIVPVRDIHQAWDVFTGSDSAELAAPPPLSAPVRTAAVMVTERMMSRTQAPAAAQQAVRDLIDSGDTGTAYAEATRLYLLPLLEQAAAVEAPTDAQITELADLIDEKVEAALTYQVDREWTGSQRASILAASSWLVEAQGAAESARRIVDAGDGATSEVRRSAYSTLTYRLAFATALFDDAVTVIEAIPRTRTIDEDNARRYLDAYLVFINAATDANSAYLQDNLWMTNDRTLLSDPWLYAGTLMKVPDEAPAGLSPVAEATYLAALAVTRYTLSSALVATLQNYVIASDASTPEPYLGDPEALAAATIQAADSVYESGQRVLASGRDPSYFTWSTQWIQALAQSEWTSPKVLIAREAAVTQAWPTLIASAGLAAAPPGKP